MGERLVLVPYLKLNGTKVAQLNYENIIKSIFYKALVLLAHPAGVEPATLSTANCASRYSGIDSNKQG